MDIVNVKPVSVVQDAIRKENATVSNSILKASAVEMDYAIMELDAMEFVLAHLLMEVAIAMFQNALVNSQLTPQFVLEKEPAQDQILVRVSLAIPATLAKTSFNVMVLILTILKFVVEKDLALPMDVNVIQEEQVRIVKLSFVGEFQHRIHLFVVSMVLVKGLINVIVSQDSQEATAKR
jgi:hypothetical protein